MSSQDFRYFAKNGYWLGAVLWLAMSTNAWAAADAGANSWEQGSPNSSAGTTSVETAAPICTLDTIKNSQLFQSGGWPGLGPFSKTDQPNEYTDANHNSLKLQVADDNVMQAELTLTKDKPTKADFLDLQMTSDFLLEGMGTKPAHIAAYNKEMDKNEESILFKSNSKVVNLSAGRYLVGFQNHADGDKVNFVISIVNQEANLSALKEHSTGDSILDQSDKTVSTVSGISKNKAKAAVSVNKKTPDTVLTRKEVFLDVIKTWQKIKKEAVRNCQTARLSEILSGRALAKQSDAVKWLITNHNYYDLDPKLVLVDSYTELVPGKKYAVYAQVKETSKLVSQATGQVLKDITDTYKVNYTIEKIGDKWVITDSAIVSPASTPHTVHPPAAKINH